MSKMVYTLRILSKFSFLLSPFVIKLIHPVLESLAASVPQDLLVHEMHRFCKEQNPKAELFRVMTYGEHAGDASLSGGTIATATFQIGKDRKTMEKDDFDPILTKVRVDLGVSRFNDKHHIYPALLVSLLTIAMIPSCMLLRIY